MKLHPSKLSNSLLIFMLISCMFVTYLSMESTLVNFSLAYIIASSFLTILLVFFSKGTISFPRNSLLLPIFFIFLSSLISVFVVIKNITTPHELIIVFRLLTPLFFYLSVVLVLQSSSRCQREIIIVYSILAFLFFLFLLFTESYTINMERGYLKQTNWGNITIAFSPLVALARSRAVRVALITALLISILYSLKRSGAMFLFVSLLFYISLFLGAGKSLSGKERISHMSVLILMPIILLALATVEVFANNDLLDIFIGRINSLGDDGGSGRAQLWRALWDSYSLMSLEHILFGNLIGANTVLSNLGINSAHNDYIGFLTNFGLIGFALFILFMLRITKFSLVFLNRSPSYNLLPTALMLGAFFTFTLTSGVFIYSTMFLPLFLMLAIVTRASN